MQSLKDIAIRFGNLSAEQQQKFLVSLKSKNIEFARLPIVAATPDRRRMLSYAQIRQWFLWKLDPASTAYHISGALRLTGRFHKEFLQIGFDALVARHESLCTVFHVDEQGQVEQRVREPGAMKSFISFQDFSMLDAQEREARARREARLLHETPFDLTAGPLLRVGLMRLQADEHLLVVAMHHIISDAWSMQILIREFVSQYRALASDEKLQLPEFPVQYADYAVWQRNWLEAGRKNVSSIIGGRSWAMNTPYCNCRSITRAGPMAITALRTAGYSCRRIW
ncbi:MAG: condensation domain-containing protein [Cellvibrionaceae bacterium]|nr:condensation domain-containing protein [Cellvibrionaceae bacterium]